MIYTGRQLIQYAGRAVGGVDTGFDGGNRGGVGVGLSAVGCGGDDDFLDKHRLRRINEVIAIVHTIHIFHIGIARVYCIQPWQLSSLRSRAMTGLHVTVSAMYMRVMLEAHDEVDATQQQQQQQQQLVLQLVGTRVWIISSRRMSHLRILHPGNCLGRVAGSDLLIGIRAKIVH